jgi:hypothetical protein
VTRRLRKEQRRESRDTILSAQHVSPATTGVSAPGWRSSSHRFTGDPDSDRDRKIPQSSPVRSRYLLLLTVSKIRPPCPIARNVPPRPSPSSVLFYRKTSAPMGPNHSRRKKDAGKAAAHIILRQGTSGAPQGRTRGDDTTVDQSMNQQPSDQRVRTRKRYPVRRVQHNNPLAHETLVVQRPNQSAAGRTISTKRENLADPTKPEYYYSRTRRFSQPAENSPSQICTDTGVSTLWLFHLNRRRRAC